MKFPIRFLPRIFDYLTVVSSFPLGYIFYTQCMGRVAPNVMEVYLQMGAAAGLLFMGVFHYLRLYEPQQSLLNVVETKRLLSGWMICSLLLFTATFYIRALDLSRLMVTTSVVVSLFLLLIERSLFYHLRLTARLQRTVHAAIFGAGVTGRHLFKRIHHSPDLGLNLIGFLDDNTTLWGKKIIVREVNLKEGKEVLGGLDKLQELRDSRGLGEVFVALPTATYQRNMEIVERCRNLGIKVSVVPPTYGNHMHKIDVEEIGGIPILREKLSEPYLLYPFFKRCFDLVVSALAIVVLSPVMLMIGIMVKLDSPGPVVFRQKRVGLWGREFHFYKFRTMYVDVNPYALTPQSSQDTRITTWGKWLRRSSLDELPQFFNVINGDMSIVGPRPEMPFITQNYNEQQRERLKVKPGITGIWQISAVRGEPIHANIEYDLFYIENQSLLLDVIIVLKTFVCAIRGIGAV